MTDRQLPRHEEALRLTDAGDDMRIGCSGCGVEVRTRQEPTAAMLDAIQRFVRDHARCR